MTGPLPSSGESSARVAPASARYRGEKSSGQYTQAHVRFPHEVSNHSPSSTSHALGTSQVDSSFSSQYPEYVYDRQSAQKDSSGRRRSHPIGLGLGHPGRGGQNNSLGAHRIASPPHSRLPDFLNVVDNSEYISSLDHSFTSSTMSPDVSGPAGEFLGGEHDPDILADLRRALKHKSRVEARLKATDNEVPVTADLPSSARSLSSSSAAGPSSPFHKSDQPLRRFASAVHPIPGQSESVDFSPSVGLVPEHPVPTSSNGGATLDWSYSRQEEERRERRWSMLSRKPPRTNSPPRQKAVVEKQEFLYTDRLLRMKSRMNSHTLRKAEIVRDQLQRRYTILRDSTDTNNRYLNLTDVVRWLARQDSIAARLFDETEPMSWLRHLRHKQDATNERSPWNLSALIIEEYCRCQEEDKMSAADGASDDFLSDLSAPFSTTQRPRASTSRPSSYRSIAASVPRRKRSDDLISFEPRTQSRNSLGSDSRRSLDLQPKELQGVHAEAIAYPQSPPKPNTHPYRRGFRENMSPVSRHSSFKAMAKRMGNYRALSDDGSSSPLESLSEDPKGPVEVLSIRKGKHLSLTGVDILPQSTVSSLSRNGYLPTASPNEPTPAVPFLQTPRPPKNFSLPAELDMSSRSLSIAPLRKQKSLDHPPPMHRPRSRATSPEPLPSESDPAIQRDKEKGNRRLVAQYERKKATLDSLRAANASMKLMLQTAARTIGEFDNQQRHTGTQFGVPYKGLPSGLRDLLFQDPTGMTNSSLFTGYKAVEYVHQRYISQLEYSKRIRESLNISSLSLQPIRSVFEGFLVTVKALCEEVQVHHGTFEARATEAIRRLEHVQEIHKVLKPEYDTTERHTSSTYPELIRVETLLDKYLSKKNQLWRLGETSLSLLLSFTAPFMKTFGRPIWGDIHDFLVIPLYRNEFSGEDNWYEIRFPKRSTLHWLQLVLSGICTPVALSYVLRLIKYMALDFQFWEMPYTALSAAMYIFYGLALFSLITTSLALFMTVLGECTSLVWWTAWFCHVVR